MAAAMFAVLLGLGTWQLERRAWKEALLARIDAAEGAPAVALREPVTPYAKLRVSGTLRHDLAAYYGAEIRRTPAGLKMGAQLIVPLERPGAAPILIDRGWVPTDDPRPIARPAGVVTLEGYVRAAQPRSWFAASDDAAKRRFHTLDPAAIGASMGLGRVAPYVLVALGPPPAEGFPQPATRLPRPANDHLGYALTWYSLAAALAGIFTVYVRKVLRP
jgi:surfeit locus 1 family protein